MSLNIYSFISPFFKHKNVFLEEVSKDSLLTCVTMLCAGDDDGEWRKYFRMRAKIDFYKYVLCCVKDSFPFLIKMYIELLKLRKFMFIYTFHFNTFILFTLFRQ